MSNQNEPATQSESLDLNAPPERPKDWFLQNLVGLVNKSELDLSIGVVLTVGGTLISGQLVGGKKYFENFAAEFVGGSEGDDDEADLNVRKTFESYGDIYDVETSDNLPPPSFVHLKDARFFNGSEGPIPTNSGVWWRGRLSEVSGFSLGTLTSNKK